MISAPTATLKDLRARTVYGGQKTSKGRRVDLYFSADVETDGPIPGPYSMLSFGLIVVGRFDGSSFQREPSVDKSFYAELQPISDQFEEEALAVNGLDRNRLTREGMEPSEAMTAARDFVLGHAQSATPVLVAYPLSFDWSWLFWYFTHYAKGGSPFEHSRCYDLKTAYAVKAGVPIAEAGRSRLPRVLQARAAHTHHALGDAIEQAEIFANVFEWDGASK